MVFFKDLPLNFFFNILKFEVLKNEFKLIVPDTRCVNLSDKPTGVENYDLKLLVDDVKKLSEKLNLGRFSLAGHDWGGLIAWGFADKYPEKLKKLIVLNFLMD